MVNAANLVFLASNVSQLTHPCVYLPCCFTHNALQGGLDSGCFLAAASSATSGELQTDATPPPPSLLILSLILSVSVTTQPIVRVQVMANRRLCCTCSHKHDHLGFYCCMGFKDEGFQPRHRVCCITSQLITSAVSFERTSIDGAAALSSSSFCPLS